MKEKLPPNPAVLPVDGQVVHHETKAVQLPNDPEIIRFSIANVIDNSPAPFASALVRMGNRILCFGNIHIVVRHRNDRHVILSKEATTTAGEWIALNYPDECEVIAIFSGSGYAPRSLIQDVKELDQRQLALPELIQQIKENEQKMLGEEKASQSDLSLTMVSLKKVDNEIIIAVPRHDCDNNEIAKNIYLMFMAEVTQHTNELKPIQISNNIVSNADDKKDEKKIEAKEVLLVEAKEIQVEDKKEEKTATKQQLAANWRRMHPYYVYNSWQPYQGPFSLLEEWAIKGLLVQGIGLQRRGELQIDIKANKEGDLFGVLTIPYNVTLHGSEVIMEFLFKPEGIIQACLSGNSRLLWSILKMDVNGFIKQESEQQLKEAISRMVMTHQQVPWGSMVAYAKPIVAAARQKAARLQAYDRSVSEYDIHADDNEIKQTITFNTMDVARSHYHSHLLRYQTAWLKQVAEYPRLHKLLFDILEDYKQKYIYSPTVVRFKQILAIIKLVHYFQDELQICNRHDDLKDLLLREVNTLYYGHHASFADIPTRTFNPDSKQNPNATVAQKETHAVTIFFQQLGSKLSSVAQQNKRPLLYILGAWVVTNLIIDIPLAVTDKNKTIVWEFFLTVTFLALVAGGCVVGSGLRRYEQLEQNEVRRLQKENDMLICACLLCPATLADMQKLLVEELNEVHIETPAYFNSQQQLILQQPARQSQHLNIKQLHATVEQAPKPKNNPALEMKVMDLAGYVNAPDERRKAVLEDPHNYEALYTQIEAILALPTLSIQDKDNLIFFFADHVFIDYVIFQGGEDRINNLLKRHPHHLATIEGPNALGQPTSNDSEFPAPRRLSK